MPTKLSRYAEGVIEAGWIATIIAVPIFFNVYSSRIFEPDKITLLRTITLLILAAWIVKLVDEGGGRWEHLPKEKNWSKIFFKIPILIPVVAIAIIYLISTLFSVTVRSSVLGSYQRLQGTYTTFSYLIIFVSIIANLRRRKQIERLITTVIIASLPIAFYGLLQRYKIDPVPWGGNVSRRIAANMGNSIFVAAYLIMVFPLTIKRIVESFRAILTENDLVLAHLARSSAYVFIGALQVIAIYMSGSRGPALGWMASCFFLFILLSLIWQKRWLTLTIIGSALALGVFLLVFNLPGSPLDTIRESDKIGRFGQLLDPEANSALVRKYIWEGAVKLVAPHNPIEFPDGSQDKYNFIRPLIGYGPESMYVAYNSFYTPELAHVERRNASPDRSHNETWDSLVITGAFGFVGYIATFIAVFYYGWKWIGLISSKRQRNLFLGLVLAGGVTGAIGFSTWRGVEYFGVGTPFGILIGLLLYLVFVALFIKFDAPSSFGETLRSLTLAAILGAIIAHFVEINFGIAIAATRTYFWAFTALLVLVGYVLPLCNEYEDIHDDDIYYKSKKRSKKKKSARKRRKRQSKSGALQTRGILQIKQNEVIVPALIIALILVIMGFNFISNIQGGESIKDIIWISLSQVTKSKSINSYGVLSMIAVTWLIGGIVLTSEETVSRNTFDWLKQLLNVLIISFLIGVIYWLWHAGGLAALIKNPPNSLQGVMEHVKLYEGVLTKFYVYYIGVILLGGYWFVSEFKPRLPNASKLGTISLPIAIVIVIILSSISNLRVIQADIAFKMAEPFTKTNQWPVAISIYKHAIELAPSEDYYYLMLARAYLAYAETLDDISESDGLFIQAAEDIKVAQSLNPLNTDHTANLARLHSIWASRSDDPRKRQEKGIVSDEYFSKALALSPYNARLWDEWALLKLKILGENDKAYELLQHSLDIDGEYDWTYAILAEYNIIMSQAVDNQDESQELLVKAADHYSSALEYANRDLELKYALTLSQLYIQLNQLKEAVDTIEYVIEIAPNSVEIWKYEQTLAQLYAQLGNRIEAINHATKALTTAPSDKIPDIQNFISQLDNDL